MTRLLRLSVALFCLLLLGVAGKTQNITNKGTDFWVGYGHHQFMEYNCNGSTPFDYNSQNMVLYISTEQAATVTVTIDQSGIGTSYGPTWWRRTYNIPANTVINTGTYAATSNTGGAGSVGPMPKGGSGTYDSRLWTDAPPAGTGGEGIFSKKAIHIESNVQVTAYAHIYGSVSSGATMLLPTNAWAYSYATINSQQGDADRTYNWVYVVAKENNTKVEITPSQPSRLGKPAGVPFTVTLNKGQIYQLIGQSDCPTGNGVQLTGTKVKSIANSSGQCYPIAVFAGSSRTGGEMALCGSSGRDNDMQQCFPIATWGKRYLTSPAAKSNGSSSLQPSAKQTHVYKILVKDPSTIVKVNGSSVIPGALINNSYYQYRSGTADYIEADKPVMVGMFFSSGSNCGSAGGGTDGDPEMLYLSPIEQAIKQVGLFRNNLEVIYSNWVNIIIPDNGMSSLSIDGIPWASIPAGQKFSYAHTNKPGYTVAVRGWPATQAQVKIQSDSAFNTFTYGLGSAESYGFNGGCFLNNLAVVSSVRNTPDTNSVIKSHPHTYVNTPTQISALITYKPTKIVWKFSAITPSGFISPVPSPDPIVTNPVPYDSILVGAGWQYYYLCPGGPFTFSKEGTYYLPVRLTSPDPEVGDCNNEEEIGLEILVKQKPFANFTRNVRGCGRDTVTFTGPVNSTNGYPVKSWSWLLSTGQTSTSKDTAFVLDPGTYTMKLSIIVEHGGIADTTISFTVHPRPTANFNINPNPACPGPVTFSTSSTYPGTTPGITNWYWDLASGGIVNSNTAANQVKTYAIGTFTIRHAVVVNAFCKSDTVTQTLTVQSGAMVDFTYPTACVPTTGVAQFTSNSSNQPGVSYTWTFGDPGSGASNTSSAQNPTHTYASNGTYNVRLQITTPSCSGDTTFQVIIKKRALLAYPGPLAAICRNAAPANVAVATKDTATGTGYYYDLSGATTSAGMFNPATAGIGTHTIWYVYTTNGGCKDSVSQTITVNNGAPKPSVVTPVTYCQNTTASPLSATATGGNTLKWYTNPALTGGSTTAPTPSTASAGTFYHYVTQTPASGCEGDSSTITVVITPAITGHTTFGTDQTLCAGTPSTPIGPTGTIAGGTGTYTYQWEQSTNSGSTWSNVPGATSVTYDPGTLAQTTWFRLKITSGLCGATSNVVKITMVPPPTNSITADQTICAGSVVAPLDGSPVPGATFGWEFSTDGGSTWNTVTSATGEDYTPTNVTLTTKYRRTMLSGPCGSFSNVVTVTVNPLADGNISGPASICENSTSGASITFAATAGTAPYGISYTVLNPSGSSTTYNPTGVANNAVIQVIPVGSAPGNYTITLNSITNSNNCIKNTGLNSITIAVTPTPVVSVSANPGITVCEGTSVTITASGANSYVWNTSATGSTLTVTPTSTTTYDVVGTTNGCSAAPKSITITVNPKPAKPSVTTPVSYCQNATSVPVSATASAGNSLTWFTNNNLTGGSATAPTPSTASAGTFYFYVNQTTAANCTGDTSTVTVIVQPSIANNTISAAQTICEGTSAAALTGAGSPTGGSGTYTYVWESSTNGGTTWNAISGATTDSYSPGSLAVTTQFRRIVSSGLCSNTSNSITVTVVPAITNYNISANQTICEGQTPAQLDGQTPPGAGPFTYTWESSLNNTTWTPISGANGVNYQPVALTATTYYRRKTENAPCSVISNTVTITVNPLANGTISGPTAICQYDAAAVTFTSTVGTAPFNVVLTITNPSGATSTITQSVSSGGQINVLPINSAAGTYTIAFTSLTNGNGCVRTTGLNSISINVTATPVITIAPAGPICQGKTANLSVSGATSYVWSSSAAINFSATTGSNVTATPATAGSYPYTVTGTTNGCNGTANATLVVNPTPGKPSVVTPVTYCQLGTSVPVSATANAGNSLTWFTNNSLTGGSATAPTPSTASAGTFLFYVNQTTAANCTGDTSTVTVIVQPSIANNTISAAQTLCEGTAAAALTGAGSPTGGSGTYTYVWESSTNGGTTWNAISGATTDSYSPGNLAVTTQFRRIVSSGLCSNTSNSITVTIVPAITNYNISANQTICEGQTPAQLDGQTPPGAGPFTYTWESSLNNTTWTPISGANGLNYQPGALTTTTYYRRKTENAPCSVISNTLTITVNPLANGTISGPTAICQYDAAAVTFTSTVGTAPFNVVLTITNPSGATSTITQSVSSGGQINVLPVNSAAGTYTIAFTSLTNGNGCVRTTGLNSISINVTATPVITIASAGPICQGKTANLSVSGATSYVWSSSAAINFSATTGSNVTATPATAGSYPYTVAGTTNGCNGTANATLVVNPTPGKPSVVTPVTYCQLGPATSLQATAASGNTLKWYDNQALTGGVNTAPTPSTANAGTFYYYVTQSNSFSCESDTSITTIVVNPGISGNSISGGETICQGSTPQTPLTGSGTLAGGNGTYTYQWQFSSNSGTTWNNISGATSANYSPGTLNTTTLYRRVVTSGLCGSISNVITETVLIGLANYDISASQTICEATQPNLLDGQSTTGTGPFTYTWQSSPDGTTWSDISSSNTEDFQPPVLSTTTYYRRKVTNGPCTGFSSPVQMTVNPLAIGSIAATSVAICEYETAGVTFTSTVGTAPFGVVLTITNPAGASTTKTVSVNSGDVISVIPINSAPGNYTIAFTRLTNSNGCARTTGLNSVNITVKPTPVITVNPVSSVCAADSATLMANGATTYSWNPNTGLSSVTGNPVKAAPAATTTYTVVGTTNGCSAQTNVAVTVNPRPVVNINVADNEICLTDVGSFSVTSSISSGSIQTYHWDFDNGNTQVNPGSITTANPQTYSTHRTYVTRLYAVSNQGCNSATDTAHIHVNPLPVAAFQTPTFVCLPNNVATFQNQSTIANGAQLYYNWNFGDPASGAANTSTTTTGTHVYPDSANYNITLNVVSAQGCTAQTSNTFNAFFRKPVAKFGVTPDTLCQGIQNLFLDSSFALGSSIQKRLWLFGDGNSLQDSTNPAKIYTRPGDYKVALVVSNTQGCTSDTAYKNIKVYLQPVIDAGSSYTVAAGTTVTFNASANSGNLQFAWTSPTGASVSNPSILKPQYIAAQDAKFILTATGQGNCKAFDSISVKVLFPIVIPNAFSPNGDGVNDKWDITNLKDYPNCVVEVYNRYGQVVYRSFGGYQNPWDGTHNGSPLPVGTYYYIIEPKNGFPKSTGFVVMVK